MLPVYKAFAFQEYAIKGGSSQPCIVSVQDENGVLLEDSYVVKIFKQHNLNHTCKEVYGSILAQHFDLKTPESALVELDTSMIRALKKHYKYKDWNVTEGVYFASKYLMGAKSFSDTHLRRYEIWEMGNIFAFDVLILNTDRQLNKPNVIIKNQDIYVIDHELSLSVSKPFLSYLKENYWDYTIKQNKGGHLFRQYLSALSKKNKVTFDEFDLNLRTLKPDLLYRYAEQLAEYEYEPFDIQDIVTYLAEIKANTSQFFTLLDNLLH